MGSPPKVARAKAVQQRVAESLALRLVTRLVRPSSVRDTMFPVGYDVLATPLLAAVQGAGAVQGGWAHEH